MKTMPKKRKFKWGTLLGFVVLAILYVGFFKVVSAPAPEVQHEVVSVVVAPGDTAWDLIRRHSNFEDTREGVFYFKQLNNGCNLQPGQEVLIPIVCR